MGEERTSTIGRTNAAYDLRVRSTNAALGRDQEIKKVDEETGEVTIVRKVHKGKPISKEDAQHLQYKALVSEGGALYRGREFRRAIDAFTQALEREKDDLNIFIDRANCYIQVGQPEDALKDVDIVLGQQPTNPRAVLAKAEAYFAMGEFEFALVYFQRGRSLRKDMSGFTDGIAKCRSSILDSINGKEVFQANPSYAGARPRKPLVPVPAGAVSQPPDDEEKLQATAKLLPEKVEPLASPEQREKFLGELSLDYQYLLELREEVTNPEYTDDMRKAEDERIAKIVQEALVYLDQRGAFWAQQGGGGRNEEDGAAAGQVRGGGGVAQPGRGGRGGQAQAAHYEMTKLQQYEARYGGAAQGD